MALGIARRGFTWNGPLHRTSLSRVLAGTACSFVSFWSSPTTATQMTDFSDPRVLFGVSWPLLDVIGSLLPTALMSPQDWHRLRTPQASETPPSNRSDSHQRRAPSPPCFIKDHLFRVVREFSMQAPGFVMAGVYLTGAGEIITSQGTLAHMLGVSKSTINRSLYALSAEGHIRLYASARETKITVLSS